MPKQSRSSIVHVSDDSYEWFTPPNIIEAARSVMGSIDCDPASCHEANVVVKAKTYFTREMNGLEQLWHGNVWLNPPYNMPLMYEFASRAVCQYAFGNVTQAMILTNNSTDTKWFHHLGQFPICFTRGRLKFWNGDKLLAARQGRSIFYIGPNVERFRKIFSDFGLVVSSMR